MIRELTEVICIYFIAIVLAYLSERVIRHQHTRVNSVKLEHLHSYMYESPSWYSMYGNISHNCVIMTLDHVTFIYTTVHVDAERQSEVVEDRGKT